jgi:hypothetical protein
MGALAEISLAAVGLLTPAAARRRAACVPRPLFGSYHKDLRRAVAVWTTRSASAGPLTRAGMKKRPGVGGV